MASILCFEVALGYQGDSIKWAPFSLSLRDEPGLMYGAYLVFLAPRLQDAGGNDDARTIRWTSFDGSQRAGIRAR